MLCNQVLTYHQRTLINLTTYWSYVSDKCIQIIRSHHTFYFMSINWYSLILLFNVVKTFRNAELFVNCTFIEWEFLLYPGLYRKDIIWKAKMTILYNRTEFTSHHFLSFMIKKIPESMNESITWVYHLNNILIRAKTWDGTQELDQWWKRIFNRFIMVNKLVK